MKKRYFTQTEDGGCTVLNVGDQLLIWVAGNCYMVANPTQNSASAKEIDFSPKMTIDQIEAEIDSVTKKS